MPSPTVARRVTLTNRDDGTYSRCQSRDVTEPGRYGITIPFDIPLHEHRSWYEELSELGYTDLWSAEVDGTDGFTPLALASAWTPSMNLGVAVAPAFTRGPGLLAQTAAAMAEAAPGRFTLGIGTSSEAIVQRWNGIPFENPYERARDTLRFLRKAFTGEKVEMATDSFRVHGFRLGRPLAEPPPVYLGALRAGMLRLAGKEADGVVVNWLSAEDVSTVLPHVGPRSDQFHVVARLFVCPTDDQQLARQIGRRMVAAYLTVEAYAEFHRWLGRGALLEGMWEAWAAGDRKRALAEIPDEVVDSLLVHGSPAQCREHVMRYVSNGVTIPALMIVPIGIELKDAIQGLAPET